MLSRYLAWTRLHKFNEISRNARQPESWTGCQESETTTSRWRTHNKSFLLFDQLVLNWSSFTRSPAAVVAPARNSYNRKHMNHKSFDGDELSSLILIIQLRIEIPTFFQRIKFNIPWPKTYTTHNRPRRRRWWLWGCDIISCKLITSQGGRLSVDDSFLQI